MDAFFASVEQRDRPELRGKPVAVGGGGDRGVVAAASYEARKFGVKSAMASRTALRLCPQIIFVKPRFDRYKAVSDQIREIFLDYTPLVEPLSLDEAYLDVTENLQNRSSATEIAIEIKQRIKETTGLTASAGISYNKFLAKTASDINKPDGLFIIKPHQATAFIATLPIRKFYGIGKVTADKMEKMGIKNGADLALKSRHFLIQSFGKVGQYYYEIAQGLDQREVNPDRIRKSIGVENTFSGDFTEPEILYKELDKILEQLLKRMHRSKALGRTLSLKIKYADFSTINRSRSSATEISDDTMIEKLAYEMLNALFPLEKGLRLMGLSLSQLIFEEDMQGRQLTLNF